MSFTSVLKKITPWIATAAELAPIPGAPVIAMAARQLSAGLGVDVKPTADAIQTAISTAAATPDQLATLKKIDDDFAVQMRQLGIQELTDLEKIDADDRASARALQVQTRSWLPSILAACAVTTLAFCIWMVGFRELKPSGHDAIILLLGAVIAIVKDVYGYVFGSSAGSDRKTELLAENGNGNSKN